jgi:pyruvate/2-oxoglutarate/acetoin dehydrogenase E1 component
MRVISIREAINEALHQEMESDETIILLGQDIGKMGGDFGVTRGLWQKFGPERVMDTPLSEAAMLGAANGAAFAGMRPVVEIMFADFITECYDQIVNNSAKAYYMFAGQIKSPIVIRTACGGGFHAAYHHSQCIEAWFMNVPGLMIVAPSTPHDAKGLMISSVRNDNPVLFLEHKMLYDEKGEVADEPYTIELGKAEVKREGSDVTVVATMKMVHEALSAADNLAREGLSVEVIDMRTLIPIDKDTILRSLAKTGRLVIAYEAHKTGGYGSEISAIVSEEAYENLRAPIKRVAALDVPIGFAPVLENYVLPHEEDIINAVWDVFDYGR